jgi:hypothetical protein
MPSGPHGVGKYGEGQDCGAVDRIPLALNRQAVLPQGLRIAQQTGASGRLDMVGSGRGVLHGSALEVSK